MNELVFLWPSCTEFHLERINLSLKLCLKRDSYDKIIVKLKPKGIFKNDDANLEHLFYLIYAVIKGDIIFIYLL